MDSVIDIAALVAPISEETPCGTDPRQDTGFDSAYFQLKDARESAMEAERPDRSAQAGDAGQREHADLSLWQGVVDKASDILTGIGKDLEVCALLVEALARTQGPAGLRDGYKVTSLLVRSYWEDLHPAIDPADPESLDDRLAAFTGLNGIGQPGTLATHIAKFPVTNSGGLHQYRGYDYERAQRVQGNPDPEKREAQESELGFSIEDIERDAQGSPAEFFVDMDRAIREGIAALGELDEVLMQHCGHSAPPSSMIVEALENASQAIHYLGKDKIAQYERDNAPGSADTEATQEEGSGQQPQGQPSAAVKTASGEISSREDAISRLRDVATYFRETEPHSPISYSLKNVIRWAQLPLDRLVEEWIQDYDARERYMLMTGMRSADDNSQEADSTDDD